jgi:hypothetical protein
MRAGALRICIVIVHLWILVNDEFLNHARACLAKVEFTKVR